MRQFLSIGRSVTYRQTTCWRARLRCEPPPWGSARTRDPQCDLTGSLSRPRWRMAGTTAIGPCSIIC